MMREHKEGVLMMADKLPVTYKEEDILKMMDSEEHFQITMVREEEGQKMKDKEEDVCTMKNDDKKRWRRMRL